MTNTKQIGPQPHEQKLTHGDLKSLKWVIDEARSNRGLLTGGDAGTLKFFDNQINKAKAALKKVRELKGQGL